MAYDSAGVALEPAAAPSVSIGEKRRTKSAVAMPVWVPLLLSLPAWIPLVSATLRALARGQVPTAFIAYDLPYYVANGRQHFEHGFHLFYNNPYANYGSCGIYFQPHIFLLGFLSWLGISPSVSLILFSVAAVAFASIVAGRLYQEWVGWQTTAQKLGFVCLFWGGGLLSVAGLCAGFFMHASPAKAVFSFDPAKGWWMLNFGRNLVFGTEAYYHGLFILAILFLVRKRFGWALAVAGVLSASHPFTGLSLGLILTVYAALEVALDTRAASRPFLAGASAITVLHVCYYAIFLNRFADHRALQAQWQLDWPYMVWTFVPGLYLVGTLALGGLTRWRTLSILLGQPKTRLCLVWFAVVFGLTQHDLVFKPRQPIHFAHGYDWMALFFLAVPALLALLEKLLRIGRPAFRTLALGGFLIVFLSDNLLWCSTFLVGSAQNDAIPLMRDDEDVLRWLDGHAAGPSYVVSSNKWINYLTPTYTHVRSWSGHEFNTPHAVERFAESAAVFSAGTPIRTASPVYYVPERARRWTPPPGALQVYANQTYDVWLYSLGYVGRASARAGLQPR